VRHLAAAGSPLCIVSDFTFWFPKIIHQADMVVFQDQMPCKRPRDEHQDASRKQLCISRPFIDSVWTALDDVWSADFLEAAFLCEPIMDFLDERSYRVDEITSDDSILDTAGAVEVRKALESIAAPREELSEAVEVLNPTPSSKAPDTPSPEPSQKASSTRSPPASSTFPCIKGRPVGVTGLRFIHLHAFKTKNGQFYRGFNLQFPKAFGLKTAKAKDKANIVSTRNEMLRRWAKMNTQLTEAEANEWIAAIDI
jgi:hypothetical protein